MISVVPGPEPQDDLERARRERDLYRRLLDLSAQIEPEPFLREALGLIVELSGARQGYLEIRGPEASTDWVISHGFSEREVDDVQSQVSSGIVAETLASGHVVDTPSAMADPRFLDRRSVRSAKIEAVLCVPVGESPAGVLYLQGRDAKGPFSSADRECAELFARHLAPLAELLRRSTAADGDPTLPYRERLRIDSVIGRSPALAALLHEVSLVAPLDVTVLLTGESGTGKSQIARAIHDNGPRASGPFVELNCGALPETLVESELFGAREGSHSAANRDRTGKVAAAEGGTLFLDEIGELALASQAKLLQFLQSGEYYPLGADEAEQANVRVLAATNADLEAQVQAGRFRSDLLFRIQVLPVRMPTLRERAGDIAALAAHFAAHSAERHGLPRLELSPGALRAVEAAEWPGHVRQLEHAVEAAVIRAAGAAALQVERGHVFPADTAAPAPEDPDDVTFQEATRRFQADLLERTLRETDWNVAETARRLDLARSYVYKLIQAAGLERK